MLQGKNMSRGAHFQYEHPRPRGPGLHQASGFLFLLHRMEEGWGEEARFYWFPLSSVLSPLVPRGERMESLMQPWRAHPYSATVSVPGSRGIVRSATILDCGGRAKRRHRFGIARQRAQSGVALRFPPQSKKCGCGCARLRRATSRTSRRMVAVHGCAPGSGAHPQSSEVPKG